MACSVAKNTIKKVMIVVPVLMTSCQVSENSNQGPLAAQPTTTNAAKAKAPDVPLACAAAIAPRSKRDDR